MRQRVSRSLATAITLAALLLLAAPQPATAVDATLVTLVGGNARAIDSATTTITFPVSEAGDTPLTDMTATVGAVVLGTVPQVADSLSADVIAADGTLVLTIGDKDAFTEQGVYQVSVVITAPPAPPEDPAIPATGADRAERTQLLALTLTRQAAAMETSVTVKVTRYVGWLSDGWPFWSDKASRSNHDSDRIEKAGKSDNDQGRRWLNPLKWFTPTPLFTDVEPPLELPIGSDGEVVALGAGQSQRDPGTVTLFAPCETGTCQLASGSPVALPTPVAPDGVLTLDYELSDFPLGPSSRVVNISSPQFVKALPVTFEVKTALSPALIPLIVILGLLVGYLVRVWIPALIASSQRERLRLDLLQIIENIRVLYLGATPPTSPNPAPPSPNPTTATASNPDPAEADAFLADALRDIEGALSSRRTRRDVVDLQLAALVTALKDANKRLTDAQATAREAGANIEGVWMLPDELVALLEEARSSVKKALTAVHSRRSSEARDANLATKTALNSIVVTSNRWLKQYRDGLDAFAKEIPAAMNKPTELKALRELLTESNAPAIPAIVTSRDALEEVSARMTAWADGIQLVALRATAEMANRKPAKARELTKALKNGDPVVAMDAGEGILALLIQSAKNEKPATPQPAAAADTVTDVKAAITAAPAAAADPAPTPTPTPTPAPTEGTPKAPVVMKSEALDLSDVTTISGARLELTSRGALLTGVGWLAQTLRFIILTIIASVVAFWVGQGVWVGDTSQLLIVFGWAFALELTTDKVKGLFGADAELPRFLSTPPLPPNTT